jgi:hypothetical protein
MQYFQALPIQSIPQKDHFKMTPNRQKEQMSLTLESRWEYFLLLIFHLTNLIFWYIYFHLNDLCHSRAFSSVG